MKIFLAITGLLAGATAFGQIGINTADPKTTLDIRAKRNTAGSLTDNRQFVGVQPPRMTRTELTSNTAVYTAEHKGSLIYITDVLGGDRSGQRSRVDAPGYYYFDGNIWQKLGGKSTFSAKYSPGTIKSSVRTGDHNGWYLLNGRAVSSLPAGTQAVATGLGFTTVIPDATDRVLRSKGAAEAFGTTGGSGSLSIAQAHLPSFTMNGTITGSTNTAGGHDHGPTAGDKLLTTGSGQPWSPQFVAGSNAWGGTGSGTAAAVGDHMHTISATAGAAALGGSGTAMTNRAPYLVVNTFIYLGE